PPVADSSAGPRRSSVTASRRPAAGPCWAALGPHTPGSAVGPATPGLGRAPGGGTYRCRLTQSWGTTADGLVETHPKARQCAGVWGLSSDGTSGGQDQLSSCSRAP